MKIGANVPADLAQNEPVVFKMDGIWISGQSSEWTAIPLKDGRKIFLHGAIFYFSERNGESKILSTKDTSEVAALFEQNELEEIPPQLEGTYIGLIVNPATHQITLFQDHHGRLDLFYAMKGNQALFSDQVEPVAAFANSGQTDPMSMVCFLLLNYTPKRHTIYKQIRRLGIQETVRFENGNVTVESHPLRPIAIQKYSDDHLDQYWNMIQTSVRSRSSADETWLAFSGGWDSTFLLASLVHEFGSKAIRPIFLTMNYSRTSGTYNPFELEKTKKIAGLLGVKLEILDYGLAQDDTADYIHRHKHHLKNKHLYYIGAPGALKASEFVKARGQLQDPVFLNGDMSDGIHNFGFSQFTTILHSVVSFSEYADKMAGYLYSPHFYQKVLSGNHEEDFVFRFFRERYNQARFTGAKGSPQDVKLNYLAPFVFGSPRMPFVDIPQSPFLKPKGVEAFREWLRSEYFRPLLERMDPEHFYYWLLHCYRNFHFQSYNAKQYFITAEAKGVRSRQPFFDSRLIDFCSAMPEDWGRGLEFRRVKYPLKWCLEHKLKFPMEILDSGPHSYVFEVDKNAPSPTGQILHESALTQEFKTLLKTGDYRDLFDETYFNLPWIDEVVNHYLDNRRDIPTENFLRTLISLVYIGRY